MQVVALSPVHVGSLVWRRDARTYVLTVVCKVSFDLLPGEMRLSSQQDVINEQDQRWEDDPGRSVHSPGDLMPFKPRADVTLVGTAFAPQGKPVRSIVARLVCGSVDKAIAVYGDRPRPGHPVYDGGSAPKPPEPAAFTRMPLRYERAAGGPGTPNPVGTPERPPNLEPVTMGGDPPYPPARPARRLEGPIAPIGFGPIAADWPERAAFLRQHAGWSPAEPFPEDLDPSFFNVAPADQQTHALRNDQALHLENLHPEHARLSTRLPGLHPQAFVERAGATPHEVEMRPDGLWIDTDRGRCAVTWRAQIPLAQRDEAGRVLIAVVGARQQLSWEDALRLDEALRGGQQAGPRSTGRAPIAVPSVVPPDDEDDDNYRTTVTVTAVKPADLVRPPAPPPPQAAPPQAQTQSSPAAIPAMPPVPAPKRTATLQGQPPPRRPTVQPVEPAPAPPPPPPPPRPTIDSEEPTATEFFVLGDSAQLGDNAPAWLTSAPRPPTQPPPAQPAPVTAPPSVDSARSPLRGHPPIEPAPAPPAEPRSPWAAGAAAAPPIAPVAAPLPAPIPPAPASAPIAARSIAAEEIVDLLWFDPEAVPRVRARWPAIIDALEFEPLDPRHDLPVDDPAGSRDRHHVFGVLTRAEPTDARGVAREVLEAIGERGRFTPPLVVVGGELRFPFDEIETLKTAAAAAKPLAKDDKKLTELLEMVNELLDTPLLTGSPSAVESLLRDLTSAVQQARRALPVKYLDAHVERVLLEKRRYQRRTVFGGPCIRALLGQGSGALPAYLPDALADRLPLMTQMRARMVAEVCASQDQYESHPHALRVVALGRVMALEGLRR